MPSEIIVNAEPFQTRVALLENGVATELYVERESEKGTVGNIYKGRVTKVLPGMQAAFVDIGLDKAGFLYVSDVDTIESIENYRKLAAEEVEDEDDEDLDFESEGEDEARPRGRGGRRRRGEKTQTIQDLLKENQEVIVQVSKEPLGTKGSRLTSYITLPGRYVVYMPTINQIGISRRIEDENERRRLRKLVRKNRQPGAGYIVRTASEGMPAEDIEANIGFLHALWDDILARNEQAEAPSLLHYNLNLIQRTVRDLFNSSVERMVIDDEQEHANCRSFLESYSPHLLPRLHHYQEEEPVFDHYGIELEIERALGQRVWLRSGGYIVIDQTEALTTIDVNTGRFVGKRNPEETILQTNLEAVREVVTQLRLRNLGGIIIVDFIDMEREESKEKVYNAFKEELRKDRSRTNILKISDLGLVEMTRKRVRDSLQRILCAPCPYCEGRGRVKSPASVGYEALREVSRARHAHRKSRKFLLNVHPDVGSRLLEDERRHVEEVERRLGVQLVIKADPELHLEGFEVIPV
ncbi:MAG: Rne/Rng family ribonuclease [Candidatus Tectomicrobia bacterium]|uniref:Ribonuclease G n=1 Tax=Tectimicrobiota bacterium TaxID=2528274 RepID=A0A932I464_UNCTE|nr:Rne/Rng family ribonuclease [Candidatus Tectomicrobia bacterium]